MLYLLKSGNYYKIGYTDNIEKRMDSYKTHNPDFILVGTKEGNKKEEFKKFIGAHPEIINYIKI